MSLRHHDLSGFRSGNVALAGRNAERWLRELHASLTNVLAFGYGAVPANLAATAMWRPNFGSAQTIQGTQRGVPLPWDSVPVGLTVTASHGLTAGSATFQVYAAGAVPGATLTWASGSEADTLLDPSSFDSAIPAGTLVTVEISTTSSFATSGSANVEAFLFLARVGG